MVTIYDIYKVWCFSTTRKGFPFKGHLYLNFSNLMGFLLNLYWKIEKNFFFHFWLVNDARNLWKQLCIATAMYSGEKKRVFRGPFWNLYVFLIFSKLSKNPDTKFYNQGYLKTAVAIFLKFGTDTHGWQF